MSRDELFALVWQAPIRQLAKQIGISDSGLRKVCLRYDIPIPPRGHWLQRQRSRPPKLPKNAGLVEGVEIEISRPPKAPSPRTSDVNEIRSEVVQSVSYAALHPLVLKCDRELTRNVTTKLGYRARWLANAVIRTAMARGHAVTLGKRGLVITAYETPFSFQMYETSVRNVRVPTGAKDPDAEEDDPRWFNRWENGPPTGILAFRVRTDENPSYGRSLGAWSDRNKGALEGHVPEAIARIEKSGLEAQVVRVERARQDRTANEEYQRGRRSDSRRKLLMEKANDLEQLGKLRRLLSLLEENPPRGGVAECLLRDLRALVVEKTAALTLDAIGTLIVSRSSYREGD